MPVITRYVEGVLYGDRMVKGLHYSVVFTASPTLTAGRILQGLTVKENLARFAWKVSGVERRRQGQRADDDAEAKAGMDREERG
jgi:hypothetical protein